MIWYVSSKTGNDASDGRSLETAFKTPQRAVEAAGAGDTILIVPGAYGQDLPQRISTARAANVTVGVVGAD